MFRAFPKCKRIPPIARRISQPAEMPRRTGFMQSRPLNHEARGRRDCGTPSPAGKAGSTGCHSALHQCNLVLRQPVKLVNERVDLTVERGDLASAIVFARSSRARRAFLSEMHLVNKFHQSIMHGSLGRLGDFDPPDWELRNAIPKILEYTPAFHFPNRTKAECQQR